MATVRFSERLVDEIKKNATDLFVDKAEKVRLTFGKDWADKIYDCAFPAEVRNHVDALPSYWFEKQEQIQLNGFHNNDESLRGGQPKYKLKNALNIPFSSAKHWPKDVARGNTGIKWDWRNTTIDFQDPRYTWLHKPFAELVEKLAKISDEKDAFVEGVKTVCDTYSTLAPALKAWPPLWDLLPQDAKDRHKKIVERTAPKQASELGIDLTSMTSAVAFSKLSKK